MTEDFNAQDAVEIELDTKDGGYNVLVTMRYSSKTRPMTNGDLIAALDMYLGELLRAESQRTHLSPSIH